MLLFASPHSTILTFSCGKIDIFTFQIQWNGSQGQAFGKQMEGIWEAHASSRHTNLTRRIDPPTPKYLKSPKLKKSEFFKIIFSDPFVIRFPFFKLFLKKLISYGSSGQTPLWKRLVNGSSNFDL